MHKQINSNSNNNNRTRVSSYITCGAAAAAVICCCAASYAAFDLGAGLTAATERIEASVRYERTVQTKYLGHIGYLKLRVNI